MMNVIFGQNSVNNRQTGGGGQGQSKPHFLKPVEDARDFFPKDTAVVHLRVNIYRGAEFIPQLLPGLAIVDGTGHTAPCVFPGGSYHAEQILQLHLGIFRSGKFQLHFQIFQFAVYDDSIHIKNDCFYHKIFHLFFISVLVQPCEDSDRKMLRMLVFPEVFQSEASRKYFLNLMQ